MNAYESNTKSKTTQQPTNDRPRLKRTRAARLTDRDRDLLGLLALARYLTVEQAHRLAFPGKHLSVAYRRLLKLSANGTYPGFARQRFFRTYDGTRVGAWTLTPHGFPAATQRCPDLPQLPKHDVGAQFLEHLLQLNELFIALWSIVGRCPRAAHPLFRWVPSDRVRLVWDEWEVREGRKQQRFIQPDAVLELPRHGRRYFLECEMGSQPIALGAGNAPGATIAKADRYHRYLSEASLRDAKRTHYQAQHPDRLAPEVLLLVQTPGRAASVNGALKTWRAGLEQQSPTSIRALTFKQSASELRLITSSVSKAQRSSPVGGPSFSAPPASVPAPAPSAHGLTRDDLTSLRRYLNDSVLSIKQARAAFRALQRADLPTYPRNYNQVAALLLRLESELIQT